MGIIGILTSLFMKTALISLMMTPVVAAVLAVRAGLARMGVSASVRYRLWALPAAALVVISLCAAGALTGILPQGAPLQSTWDAAISASGDDDINAVADMSSEEAAKTGMIMDESGNTAESITGNSSLNNTHMSSIHNVKGSPDSNIFGNAADRLIEPSGFMVTAAVLWLAGVIAVFICALLSCARIRRQTRFAVMVRDSTPTASADKKRMLNIYESNDIKLPFVSGVIRPKIYMPAGISDDDAENIIAHEEEHIRRRDSVVLCAAWICCALSWFDPLLWAGYAILRRDMEMSCDEAVTGRMDRDGTAGYMNTMLRMSAPGARFGQNAFAPGFAAGESDVEMRVENIVREKKHRPLVTVAAIVLCIAVIAGCVFGYSRYQSKYYNINDVELLTSEQVVKLLRVNGVRLTSDDEYDAHSMAVKLNSEDDDTGTVPSVYNVRTEGMDVKVFIYIFERYINYDSDIIDIPYPGSQDTNDDADDSDTSMWKASMGDRVIYGKNILAFLYIPEGELFKGLNADRQSYEAGANISESDMNTIARRNRAYNDMNDNINNVLFYKAFDGTDTIYAGESGDWRFAFPVKMFSLSYTDHDGHKWDSAMKSAGSLYVSYRDGDPTMYGPVQDISIKKGDLSSSLTFDDNDHLEYVYDESSDSMGGMYRVTNFDFAGRFKYYCSSLDVTLGLKDGSEITAECTDIE